MIAIAAFLAMAAGVAAWWLSQQRLTAKPWLEEGAIGEFPGGGASTLPAAKLGLWVFLAVASALFALFVSATLARMGAGDWRRLPLPGLLWFNTGLLVAGSLAMQSAVSAARRGQDQAVRNGLLVGGLSALTFLAGQLLVWRQLAERGAFAPDNPASAFFCLLTAVHGLHVAGGLIALGRTANAVQRGRDAARERLGVQLCAIYWHFLLLVWLILFAVLQLGGSATAAAKWLYALCSGAPG